MRQSTQLSKVKSHEEIIVENYDWLVGWALHLTEGLPEEAKDLVHDLFVLLILSRPHLETNNEDRVRAYLYTMLRNLAVSRARRRGHDPLSSLSIVDYDSVACGLAAVDRTHLIFVRSDLSRVCEYANRRKHTSRAASILILRFFLSYYPSEIVRMLGTTRIAIEKSLQAARLEARAFIRRPQSLRFLGHDIPLPPLFPSSLPDQPEALYAELRRRVLSNKCDGSSRPDAICQRYEGDWTPLETEELAHVVGCAACLDAINRTLGIPTLSERLRSEPTDRDSGSSAPPAAPDVRTSASVKRKLADTYEHEPRKLQIAVDGEIRASQKVSRTRNELEIQLEPLARPSFLEVFSEQKVRLLYLQLDDSAQQSLMEQSASVELSDGRSIKLQLRFPGGTAVVSALYNDEQLEELSDESTLVRAESNSRRFHAPAPRLLSRPRAFAQSLTQRVASRWTLGTLGRRILIGLALASLGFFVLGYLALRHRSPGAAVPTVREVLFQSGNRESLVIEHGAAVHSRYKLETLSNAGTVLETSTVERWESHQPKRSSLRMTTQKGTLLAGRWQDPQGHLVTYTRQHGFKREQAPARNLPEFQNAWDLVPGTASAMSSWQELEKSATLHQSADTYEIDYQRLESHPVSGILSATLTINAAAMRPIREDLVLTENGERKEYRFEELSYDIVPASQLEDSDFTPPSESASLRSSLHGPEESEDHTARLMLAALEIVERLEPEVSDAIDLERLPDGRIQVSGVLPSDQQRDAVQDVFASLRADHQLKLALHSRQEPAQIRSELKPAQAESTTPVAMEDTHIPLDPELRSSLSKDGFAGAQLEARIRAIASAAVNDGASLHRDAWFIQQIAAEDFSRYDLERLRREDQRRWLALLNAHTRLFNQHLAQLRTDLSFLPARPPSSSTSIPPIDNSFELSQAAEGLNHDCERIARLLTAGMTLDSSGETSASSTTEIAEVLEQIETREKILSATVERLSSAE